jgi:hypothetical protein
VRVDRSPAHRLRARQLTSVAERHTIATALVHILAAAEECVSDNPSRLRLQHRAVLDARPAILELSALLRNGTALEPRGIALAHLLINERRSPIFVFRPDRTVEQALTEILRELRAH